MKIEESTGLIQATRPYIGKGYSEFSGFFQHFSVSTDFSLGVTLTLLLPYPPSSDKMNVQ
jgi:hypothetical protein